MRHTLSTLVRSLLLEEATRDVRYSSLEGLRDSLRSLIDSVWEGVREDAISRFPSHEVVLRRTRLVQVFSGADPVPPGVLRDTDSQGAEFVSKCDDLFATTRGGTKCRAEGNLANPPTHNAVYLDVSGVLGLSSAPKSGTFRFRPDLVSDLLMHELSHAVDRLSSVVGGDRIRDSHASVVEEMFDDGAMRDRDTYLQQFEDRLIQAGGSDEGVARMMTAAGGRWDYYVGSGWLTRQRERVAAAIQLSSLLDQMGITGPEFLEMNLADDVGAQDEARGVIDFNVLLVLYGVLDSEGVDGLEQISDATG
jgi:hypothetical protein